MGLWERRGRDIARSGPRPPEVSVIRLTMWGWIWRGTMTRRGRMGPPSRLLMPRYYSSLWVRPPWLLSMLIIGWWCFNPRTSDMGCSEKLHLRSYLEMLWSEIGYFGLLGNTYISYFYSIISYQWIKFYRVEIMDIGKISLTHWRQWNMQMEPSQ